MRYIERTRETNTNMLALKTGQLNSTAFRVPRFGTNIFPDLLDDSTKVRRKSEE